MPILHKNITASADIHNPKWFSDANNGDYAWRNEQGNLETIDELLLPAALNFVDASVAPPTSNANDIYVLSSGGSVHVDWGSVSVNDWVRYDGTSWNSITPQKSSLCYDENSDTLLSFNGLAWAALGGDSIYTASSTAFTDVEITIDNTLTFKGGDFRVQGDTTLSTDTALAIYDGDTTPNKLWDFRNNGDVNLSQTSSIISTQADIFKFNSSGLNPSVYINATSGTNNSSLVFQNQNNNKWLFGNEGSSGAFRIRNLVSIKNIISISSGDVFNFNESSITSAKFNIGGDLHVNASSQVSATFKGASNTYVNIDNGSSTDGCSIGYSTNGSLKWLTGYEGGTGSFRIRNIANASNPILISSSNVISLQGDVLMNANVNMPNLPTSSAGLSAGDIWNDGGTLKIV